MRVTLLASGSKGNALYVETGDSRILVDAGLSLRALRERLALLGVAPEELDAILVSHEHGDHCRGLGPLARQTQRPVWIDPAVRSAGESLFGHLPQVREFVAGERLQIRDVIVETFSLTHDAAATTGFVIDSREGRVGVATDLGIATRLVTERLKKCRALLIEFNHDEILLRDGPYPWPLKQRIRGSHGHLSNGAAADLLADLLWDGLEAVFVGHLSETNNTEALALNAARSVLDAQNLCAPALIAGRQHEISVTYSNR